MVPSPYRYLCRRQSKTSQAKRNYWHNIPKSHFHFLFDFLGRSPNFWYWSITHGSIPTATKDGTQLQFMQGDIQDLWRAGDTPELPPWQDAVFLRSLWTIFFTVRSHEDTYNVSHRGQGIWMFAVWQGFQTVPWPTNTHQVTHWRESL